MSVSVSAAPLSRVGNCPPQTQNSTAHHFSTQKMGQSLAIFNTRYVYLLCRRVLAACMVGMPYSCMPLCMRACRAGQRHSFNTPARDHIDLAQRISVHLLGQFPRPTFPSIAHMSGPCSRNAHAIDHQPSLSSNAHHARDDEADWLAPVAGPAPSTMPAMSALPSAPQSRLRLYLDLIRWDRPAGWLLLLWPTLAALWLAAKGFAGWHLLSVFTLGTILMRSAGCCINDVADREFDRHVKRTA